METTEVAPPPMTMREYKLPGGCSLQGYGKRLAVLFDRYTEESVGSPIRLLDLETGKHARVRERAVGFSEGYRMLGLRCSDEWVAWEELKGDEQQEPLAVRWRLYVARIDKDALSVGAPILVDENQVSIASRPLFAFIGDEIFWMTNSMANTLQEGAVDGARVRAKKLPDGAMREVLSGTSNYRTVYASEGRLFLSQFIDSKTEAERLIVVDPATGVTVDSHEMENIDREISHCPSAHDGALAWTIMPDPAAASCDVLYRGAGGPTMLVEEHAGDPLFVGSHIFYESDKPESTGTGTERYVNRIRGVDPVSGGTFTLLEAERLQDGMWILPIRQPYSADSFLVVNDLSMRVDDSPDTTLVRRYTIK